MAAAEIDKYQIAAELFPDQPEGFPFEVDPHDVKLPKGEDFGIKSDDDEADEADVVTESGFGSVIVVSNLPVVPQEKYEKLCTVVRKIYSQIGNIREAGLSMPLDSKNEQTLGFAFIEFNTPQEAQAARAQTNGYKLDKNHTFVVNMFDDFDKYSKTPDVYQAPEVKEYTPTENLNSWMVDKLGRDQFLLRHGDEVAIFWNDGKRSRAEQVYQRQYWTESFTQWSPNGTYLATLHRQGVAVWGGPNFARLARFAHPNCRLLQFSPNERFLISFSSQDPATPRDSAVLTLIVFDTRTGKKLRLFEGPAEDFTIKQSGPLPWPLFKWAGGKEDMYFARIGRNAISVYQSSDMSLLDKKSLKLDEVQDFEWSPSEAILAAYQAEQNNLPARITLIKIPERTELRTKNLFSVSDVKIFWHPQGDYLAVKVDKFTKSKKSTITNFEFFSLRDKDIPMEVFELLNVLPKDSPCKNDKVLNFAWEPRGHRFCIVHGEGVRPSVSFFSMRDDKGRVGVRWLATMANKACNAIYWSPQGHHIILAGLKNLNGQLEFFNVDELETMATAEHFMASEVEWDPTGRYVVTGVYQQQADSGFKIWSFNGRNLYSQSRDRLFQFMWRPRLPSLLSAEKEAEIQKNLKQYTKKYDEEDEALLMQADADVLQERQRMMEDWQAYQARRREYVEMVQAFRREMHGARAAEQPFALQKTLVEQVLDIKEDVYNPK